MPNFTPGPWKWAVARTQQHLHDANGDCFAHVSMPTRRNHAYASHLRESHEADAHLIAAAPDLYSALKRVHNSFKASDEVCDCTPAETDELGNRFPAVTCLLCDINAALAKAEGR